MRGRARIFFSIPVILIVVVLAGAIVFIKSDFAAERICTMLDSGLEERLGVGASIESCAIDLLPPALETVKVKVEDRHGGRLLLAESLRFELDSLSLLAGDFQVDRIVIRQPQVYLRVVDGAVVNLPGQKDDASSGEPPGGGFLPESVALEGGRIDLVLDQWGLLQLRGVRLDLLVGDERRFDISAEVGGGSLDLASGLGTSFSIHESKCKASLDAKGFDLASCSLGVGELSVKAGGRVDFNESGWKPKLNATVAGPLGLIHQLVPAVPHMEGQAIVSADATLENGKLEALGALDVKGFGLLTLSGVDLKSSFKFTPERLDLTNLRVSCSAGQVSGDAWLELGGDFPFGGKLQIEQGELWESLRLGGLHWRYIELRGSGPAEAKGKSLGKGAPFVTVKTRFNADRLALRVDQEEDPVLVMDGAIVTSEAHFNSRRVRFLSARIEKGGTVLDGKGRIRFTDYGLDVRLQSDKLNLVDLGPIAGLRFEGKGGLELELGGGIFGPVLESQVYIQDLVFEDHPIGTIRGRLALADFELRAEPLLLSRHGGTARFSGGIGLMMPHRLDATVELVRIKLPELVSAVREGRRISSLTGGLVGGSLTTTGTLATPVLDFRLGFADVVLGGQRFDEGGAVGRYERGAWRLDLLEASMGSGWIFARGAISEDLVLDLMAYSTGLRADSFQVLATHKDLLDFRLDLHVTLRGHLLSPALDGWAKFYDTTLSGRELADSSFSAKATTESFGVHGKIFGGMMSMKVDAKLTQGLPFEASLAFGSDKLGRFLPRVADSALPFGALQGSLKARGLLLSPRQIQADLRLDRSSLSLGALSLQNAKPILADLRDGIVDIKQCELRGTETELAVTGGGDLTRGPRVDVEGTIGLGLVPILSDLVPRAVGRANLRLGARGSWADPRLSGSLAFTASHLSVKGLTGALKSVTGQLQFTPSKAEFTRIAGRFGGGTFTAWGDATLTDSGLDRLAMTVELNRVRYQATEGLWGRGTGTLSLTRAQGQRLRLSGQVRIHEGGYEENISLVSFSNGLFRRRRPRARTYEKKNEVAEFDIRLIASERFQVIYNLNLANFQSEMKGDMRLTGTNERLGLLGDMEALSGEVSYLSKTFAADTVRVGFKEKYAIEPRFEIRAARDEMIDRGDDGKTTYRIHLGLLGEGEDIRITLRSEPALDERDIITLLSLGVTSRDLDTLRGDDLVGLGGEIFLRSFKLDERLSKVFPFPPELIQPKYVRMRSRFSKRLNTTTPRVEAGVKLRLISEDLDLDYSRSIYEDSDQSLELSYKLSERLSAHMRWEDTGENDVGDLGLDLKLSWEW